MSNKEEIINKLSKIEEERKKLEDELKKVEDEDIVKSNVLKCIKIINSKNIDDEDLFGKYFNIAFDKDEKILDKFHDYEKLNTYTYYNFLLEAISHGKPNIVLFLINKGANPNITKGKYHPTPLISICIINRDEQCQMATILTHKPNTFKHLGEVRSAYSTKVFEDGSFGITNNKRLNKSDVDFEATVILQKTSEKFEVDSTALQWAIECNNFPMILYLCANGANMYVYDSKTFTEKMVKFLYEPSFKPYFKQLIKIKNEDMFNLIFESLDSFYDDNVDYKFVRPNVEVFYTVIKNYLFISSEGNIFYPLNPKTEEYKIKLDDFINKYFEITNI